MVDEQTVDRIISQTLTILHRFKETDIVQEKL